jgi:quercetin dioxygenase-like cupin family protein
VTELLVLPGGGTRIGVVLSAEDTGGALTLLDVELEPGSGAGPHRHTKEDETIYLLSGSLRVGDRTLAPGEAAHLPRGVMHSFANEGQEVAKVLFVCVPGGLERFFRAVVSGDDATIAAAVADAGLEFD